MLCLLSSIHLINSESASPYSSQLPPAHESLPPTPQTAPPHSAGSHPPGSAHSTGADSQASGNQVINMRCLIVTMDASVIIGKGGRHIAEIRVSRVFLVPCIFLSSHARLFMIRCQVRKKNEGPDQSCQPAYLRICDRAKPTPESTSPNPSPVTPSGSSAFKALWTRLPRSVSRFLPLLLPFNTACCNAARLISRIIGLWTDRQADQR